MDDDNMRTVVACRGTDSEKGFEGTFWERWEHSIILIGMVVTQGDN